MYICGMKENYTSKNKNIEKGEREFFSQKTSTTQSCCKISSPSLSRGNITTGFLFCFNKMRKNGKIFSRGGKNSREPWTSKNIIAMENDANLLYLMDLLDNECIAGVAAIIIAEMLAIV